jgi:uncharacterized protein YndB with AHSA1/START domain
MPSLLITLEFIEEGRKTRLRSTGVHASVEDLESHLGMGVVQGLTETLDRLEEYLRADS